MIGTLALLFFVSFGVSLLLVPLCRKYSLQLGYVAEPRQDRWHRRRVALFGGVAIGVTLLALSAAFGVAAAMPVVVAGAFMVFIVGLVDDITTLKPSTKLIAQIALASGLLFFDYRLHWVESVTLDSMLTLLWVVGLTNAFNLLDNMDGLCAGVSIISGLALGIGLLQGVPAGLPAPPEVQYLTILMGATAGFLVYNLHPASIFMGDSGALLLGFSFGAVTLSTGTELPVRPDVISIVAAPVLVLLIPIFDTTLVTVSRVLYGRSASQGGRDHSSHRLVAIGLSERRAVAVLWLLAATGGLLGVALSYVPRGWAPLGAVGFFVAMGVFAAYLAGIRVHEDEVDGAARPTVTPIIVDFMYKRRVAEVLLDFCLVAACHYAAYRLRFEDPEEFLKNFDNFTQSLPIVMATQMIAFFVVGLYRGVWRHFGTADALVVARGVVFGAVASQLVILYVYRFFSYSRTVFAIYAVLLLIGVTLSRMSFRLVGDFFERQRTAGRSAVIYGADDGGGLALSQLAGRGEAVRVLGFIDDDPRRAGLRINGYPILGGFSALSLLISTHSVDLIVIGTAQLPPERLHNLRALCVEHSVNLSRLHIDLQEIVSGDSAVPPPSATVVAFPPKG